MTHIPQKKLRRRGKWKWKKDEKGEGGREGGQKLIIQILFEQKLADELIAKKKGGRKERKKKKGRREKKETASCDLDHQVGQRNKGERKWSHKQTDRQIGQQTEGDSLHGTSTYVISADLAMITVSDSGEREQKKRGGKGEEKKEKENNLVSFCQRT